MEFGYFTLSDNHYPNNPRSANDFVLEIREQALLADRLGMHSCWIGEHHFDSLGVNSRPDLLLANIASQTKHVRLAPAVTVLPLHHPVHVAEMWATLDLLSGGRVDFATGRGYDRKEYAPFCADFMASAEIFEEGIHVLRTGGSTTTSRKWASRPSRCGSRCPSTSLRSRRPASTWRPGAASTSSTRPSPPAWCAAAWTRRWRPIAKPA
jgi:alkanesulfonate monooxygenase SsuD/methylene tetrahydromethanopterin reductase-like flavin-dependent oxidoreductase (luciferase family)